jgi:hypothetical protein
MAVSRVKGGKGGLLVMVGEKQRMGRASSTEGSHLDHVGRVIPSDALAKLARLLVGASAGESVAGSNPFRSLLQRSKALVLEFGDAEGLARLKILVDNSRW